MNKIITMTTTIQPIVEHIQDLQKQLKIVEAELKQYKSLLQNDYMLDAVELRTVGGLKVAAMISSSADSLDKVNFEADKPTEFAIYKSYMIKKFFSYLKVN
jgi:hypothetical protein